jgi:filamentous hemagglutinin family protein
MVRWDMGIAPIGKWRSGLARILTISGAIALVECLVCSGNHALAQITPDGTLGTEGSIVIPNANIRGLPAESIEGGALRGANLFHSFSQFNVQEGLRVYFANPVGIENILTRVTGNNLSNILGTLGVDGTANLFLLNPNGIIFGANAQLDIAGSFVASTANSVVFENGFQFSATNPEAPPLLTIKVIPGLQYGSNHSGVITNAGNLAVGQNMTLAAGNLDLQGQLQAGGDLTLFAQDTVMVRDHVASPFIASSGGQLLVQGDRAIDIFALNHPNSGLFSGGDMVLRSANTVGGDAHYWSGGSFQIEQLDGSLGNLSSPDDPIIRASGNVRFDSYQGASLHILAGGSVNIRSVTITGTDTTADTINPTTTPAFANVTLSDGTPVVINGSFQPTLDVRAGMNSVVVGTPGITDTAPPFGNFSPISTGAATTANITINDIAVNAANGLVFLTNQYQPNTALDGNVQVTRIRTSGRPGSGFSGNSGSIVIDSRGNITIPDSGTVRTDSTTGKAGDITFIANGSFFMTGRTQLAALALGQGNAGNINIVAGNGVFMTGRAQMAAFTTGQGDAGNINIVAGNSVSLTGDSFISTDARPGAVGNGSNINIQATSLLIDGRAALQADTYGTGNAGSIIVQVNDSISLTNGGFISSVVQPGGTGQGGDIQIDALGSVNVSGFDAESGYSSALLATTKRDASGQAGRITVNTGTLRVADGALIDTSTLNSSDGGSVAINANSLELIGGGQILALTRNDGTTGNISLDVADTVTISGNDSNYLSRLTQFGLNVVTNQGGFSGIFVGGSIFGSTGNGGNLSISTRQLDVSDRGVVTTAIFGTGNAGNLSINATDSISVSGGGTIATSSSQGNGGNLSIFTGQLQVSGEETFLTTVSGTGNAGTLSITAIDSMSVSDKGIITTSSSQGNSGNLSINTSRLDVSDRAEVGTISLGTGNAGNLAIAATDLVNVSNEGLVTTGTNPTSGGNSGTLSISTRQLDVKDRGQITSASTGTGNSGNLSVVATDSINVVNRSLVTTSSAEGAGIAGRLEIQTGKLSIRDGSLVVSSTVGAGDAGDLTVQADDSIEVVNDSKLSADTIGRGNGGNVTIETNNLSIRNSEVSTATSSTSSGRGGTLNVTASDAVEISGLGGLVTGTAGSERAGDLSVTTGRLTAQGGGRVEAGTAGIGQGGTVTVNALESIELSGSSTDGKSSSSISAKSGAASNLGSGNVNISTGELIIRDGAEITSETLGIGKGGDIQVQANSLSVNNGGSITSRSEGQGNSGNVQVQANSVFLTNGGRIISRSEGQGLAGNIDLRLQDTLQTNGGEISASSDQSGGGEIKINTPRNIFLRNGSLISTSVFDSTGGGGNIMINSDLFLALEDSDILANAEAGPGGNITINSPGFLADLFSSRSATPVGRNPGSFAQFRGNGRVDISAESQTGTSGTVVYPNVDPTQGAVQLPTDVVDASRLIDRRCTGGGETQERSSFTVTGRGGLPPSPNQPLVGESLITNWVTLDSEQENRDRAHTDTNPTSTTPKRLVEAQSWVIGRDGQVILTAQANTVTPQTPGLTMVSCQEVGAATH